MEEYLQNRDVPSKSQESVDDPEKVLSFTEIKHLIETGQAHLIPNNKKIEEKINAVKDVPPSASVAKTKPKPWENHQTASE
ncbi:hypothetical protein FRC17_003557 [Serendipita sp. 399]|nr:hypothetical protein FRC17_003557 [Serendipita sp. 399]